MIGMAPPRENFADHDCDPVSKHQDLLLRHPRLAVRDIAIAEAAAKAGFDCDSWPKLETLINAVRDAGHPPYPDYWPKPGTWSSAIYPDRYRAELQRARKGVAQSYRDVDFTHQATTVPAFVVPAKHIIENVSNIAYNPAMVIFSGGKRGHDNFVDHNQGWHKRIKTGRPSKPQYSTSNYIDLTQDGKVKTSSSQALISRSALGDISNNIAQISTSKQSTKKKQPKHQSQDQSYRHVSIVEEHRNNKNSNISRQTNTNLSTTARRLKFTAANIDTDRDALRYCWQIDDGLKEQDVTNDLAELNECFTRAEEAVMEGIRIIEERLLTRR